MEGEKLYVGSKIIRAIPMDEFKFLTDVKNYPAPDRENMPGYKVTYPDGYVSWSPKAAFDAAYREVTDGESELFDEIS